MTDTNTQSSTEHSVPRDNARGLHRQWQILSKLTTGKWLGTRQLQYQLKREGVEIGLRTIQRDLNQLAKHFPIESNSQTPQGWRWQQNAQIASFPIMNTSQAITFMMVEEHLNHLLPPSLLHEMRPWFDLAKRSIVQETHVAKDWINRVKIIPATQPLLPPQVNTNAQRNIYEALLLDKQLQVQYQKRDNSLVDYIINPLALIQRGPILYLVGTHTNAIDLRLFALHRFTDAVILEQRSTKPKDFNLDSYIENGALGFQISDSLPKAPVEIQLQFTAFAGQSLLECKLSKNQVSVVDEATGNITVTATVPITAQLIWWLRGFGAGLLSLTPAELAAMCKR